MNDDADVAIAPRPTPLADPVAEGARVAEAAGEADLALRLTGGVAIAILCPSSRRPPLGRAYGDIDLAGRRRDTKAITALLSALGYRADIQFNTLQGERRLLFWDTANDRQLDVFLDVFEMCHRIELTDRLAAPGPTIPLADLLLTKLQIVETNEKDLTDIVTLLVDHDFTDDASGIELSYIAGLCRDEWGLWRTTTMVMARADAFATALATPGLRERVHEQAAAFLERLEREPKSRRWRLRARVGERARWYEQPENAH